MDLNPYLIILYGGIGVLALLAYFFNRDRKNKRSWLGRRPLLAYGLLVVIGLIIVLGIYVRFIEPNWLRVHRVSIPINGIKEPVRVVVVSDLHAGEHKREAWIQKVVTTILSINPDLVLLAGDYTVNEGVEDESVYLSPLRALAEKLPVYAVLGNHEYGYRAYDYQTNYDKSTLVSARLAELNVPLLVNELECPTIKQQVICLFGMDEVYRQQFDFSALKKWPPHTPLIQISHNPDGILFWPKDLPLPDLEVSGHTHGGQLWLPWLGPLGQVESRLGTGFYRWLNFWNKVPIFTTVGTSESGAPLRLFTPPEVAVITLEPQR